MIIKSAEFMRGAVKPADYPPQGPPEVAFAGRSNVGKSSLINCLVNRKKLVKTSNTPGRTQQINFFEINETYYFVDLPGYGYARVSKALRAQWGPMIGGYVANRPTLALMVMLVDVRRQPEEEEIQLLSMCKARRLDCMVIVTKADKVKQREAQASLKFTMETLGLSRDSVLLFSTKTRMGRDALWEKICDIERKAHHRAQSFEASHPPG